jgi:hypothetical protein
LLKNKQITTALADNQSIFRHMTSQAQQLLCCIILLAVLYTINSAPVACESNGVCNGVDIPCKSQKAAFLSKDSHLIKVIIELNNGSNPRFYPFCIVVDELSLLTVKNCK